MSCGFALTLWVLALELMFFAGWLFISRDNLEQSSEAEGGALKGKEHATNEGMVQHLPHGHVCSRS